MLLECIDPRVTTHSVEYMDSLGLTERYSHFVIAGGPIGAVHPAFEKWHDVFWENLDLTVQMHKIKRLIGLTHRDCGAAKLAYGETAVSTRQVETATHAECLRGFRAEVRQRHPELAITVGIMDLEGKVLPVG